jgi:hypothetical protein
MRRPMVSIYASSDGYIETEKKALDWFVFEDEMHKPLALALKQARPFSCGNVVLYYGAVL